MKKNNLVHSRTCVYNVNYHIVFSTKYRKRVLKEEIIKFLNKIFHEIADGKGFIIQKVEVGEEDHVHVFASVPPKLSPSYIVQMLKGISARRAFMQFPYLKLDLRKGHLWNPSYYIETIGSISEEIILKYIENQSSD